MQMNKNILGIIMLFSLLLFICSYADAEQMYIWTDEDGNVHYSKTEPENWETQKYKQTEESQQTEILRGGEKSTSESQSKAEEGEKNLQSQGSGGKTNKVTGRRTTVKKKG